ncbi:unnamed protein product [Arctia plantaginis]|uniref:Uncharacterized protein n=1 Tax=Arctia plantaginis TaxID=874455 RepID=A0A8S0ZQ10_ARCPL|nr:unnamed protein product [Arctia plantaginis]
MLIALDSRAIIISFTAIGVIISKNINEYEQFRKVIEDFLVEWPDRSPFIEDCESDNNIQKLTDLLTEKLSHLENNGPTAKLWVQYFKLVLIALQFIEAERLGNSKLHLQIIKKKLLIFHAAGHYPYA